MPSIEFMESPNHWDGRNGRTIIAIVDHITDGLMDGCLSWLRNPASKASANYLVTRTGRIIQLVKDEDTAWANGNIRKPSWPLCDGTNPNRYVISIEHEGKPDEPLTEAQYQATLWLHRQLIAKYHISVDDNHIIGHYRIDSVVKANCPGPMFPWKRLFADLKGQSAPTQVHVRIGQTVFTGVEIDGTAYAWVRDLVTVLGGQVVWSEATKTAVVPPAPTPLKPGAGPQIAVGIHLLPCIMVGDRLYGPVRAIAEAMGHPNVTWDAATNTVVIS